jgi:hypothetical protein
MTDLIIASSSVALPVPEPREAITIRPGTVEDIPFLDSLQKLHTKQVGWMPTKTFEGKVKLGHVLVAWASRPCAGRSSDGSTGEGSRAAGGDLMPREEERVGYLIGNDQYFKRDDVGIIYQMNVLPGKQNDPSSSRRHASCAIGGWRRSTTSHR